MAKFHCSDQTFLLRLKSHSKLQAKPTSYITIHKPSPCRSIRASSSSSNPKPSFLKTTCVTLTTAAALLSASLHLSASATQITHPPPPSSTETDLTADESIDTLKTPLIQHRHEEEEEEEEARLEKHLASHPNDIEALESLMKIKLKSKNLHHSLEILDRLIEIDPEDLDWRILKAQVQTYDNDFDSATQGFEEVVATDPFRIEAYHGLVMSYSDSESKLSDLESRINEAMEKCRKEDKKKKKKHVRDFMLLIAQIKVIQGNPVEALGVYQELVKDEPCDYRPYLCQGLIYTLMKKKDQAEKQFEQFRRLVPENHPYNEYFDANVLNTNKLFSQ